MGGQVPSDRGALEHYILIYSKSNNAHNWDRIGTTQSMFEIYPKHQMYSNIWAARFRLIWGAVPGIFARRLYNINTCTFHFISPLPKSVPHETSKWLPTCPYIFTNMHFWPCPLPMVTVTPIQGIYYSKFLLRAWQRIKMVWKLAHQVKLERDQGNWIPG